MTNRSRLSGWLPALIVGCAVPLTMSAVAEEAAAETSSDIRALLATVPADDWSAASGGFYAIDFAALRNQTGAGWPVEWPSLEELEPIEFLEAMESLQAMFSHINPPPTALRGLSGRLVTDPLDEISVQTLSIDGLIEVGFFRGRDQLTVMVGDGMADPDRIAAQLGQPGSVEEGQPGFHLWRSNGPDSPDVIEGSHLIAMPPDVAAIQSDAFEVAPVLVALQGESETLADQAAVAGLLEAVDGPVWASGQLIALMAAHPDSNTYYMQHEPGSWPADAALPEYVLVGLGLRHDQGMATGLLVLVYPDAANAQTAVEEMTARVPMIEDMIGYGIGRVSLEQMAAGMSAVVLASDSPINEGEQHGLISPFHSWVAQILIVGNAQPIAP